MSLQDLGAPAAASPPGGVKTLTRAPRVSGTWTLAIAGLVGMTVSGNPVGFSTNSLFLGPIVREFGWSRVDYFTAPSIAALCGAAFVPFVGRVVDRAGVRRCLLPGIVLYAAAVASYSLLTGSLALYLAIALFQAMASMVQGPLPYSKAITLGADRHRGLALAVAMAGSAVGVIYVPPLAAAMIESFGWRGAKIGLGLLVVCVALPTALLFLRPPERLAVAAGPGAPPGDVPGMSLGQAVRTRVFWLLALAFLLSSAAIHGVLGHLGAVAVDRGLGIALAATCLSAMGAAQLAARFGSGYLLDRFSTPQVGQLWFLMALGGVATLSMADRPQLMIAGSVLLGLGLGSELELLGYYVSRFFGLKAFGQIYGLIFSGFMLGLSGGPYLMAQLFDRNGGYGIGFVTMEACLGLAALTLAGVGRYVFASQHAARKPKV